MLNLYRSSTGEHVRAENLNAAEAVAAFASGALLAVDLPRLSAVARDAVMAQLPRAPRSARVVVVEMRGAA